VEGVGTDCKVTAMVPEISKLWRLWTILLAAIRNLTFEWGRPGVDEEWAAATRRERRQPASVKSRLI